MGDKKFRTMIAQKLRPLYEQKVNPETVLIHSETELRDTAERMGDGVVWLETSVSEVAPFFRLWEMNWMIDEAMEKGTFKVVASDPTIAVSGLL